jgi:hypothetical protein
MNEGRCFIILAKPELGKGYGMNKVLPRRFCVNPRLEKQAFPCHGQYCVDDPRLFHVMVNIALTLRLCVYTRMVNGSAPEVLLV